MRMKTSHFLIIYYALISLAIISFKICFSVDTITPIYSIKDGNTKTTLVSIDQTFELGFFSPDNSKNRYVGIWYKITPDVVVWVANRNNPLDGPFGEFAIGETGNLVLLDGTRTVVWCSNSSRAVGAGNSVVARLLSNGNLVLREQESAGPVSVLWQSFDHPTDTFLEGMKFGWDFGRGLERHFTSWKSAADPADGNCTIRIDLAGLPRVILEQGTSRKWRAGPWNGVEFSGVVVDTKNIFRRIYTFNENESSIAYVPINSSAITRVRLRSAGKMDRFKLQSGGDKWDLVYSLPYDLCDNYGYCGVNSICKMNGNPICLCLKGFVPTSQEEWEFLNWSRGCVRKTRLGCDAGDGFEKLVGHKLPDLSQFWLNKSMSLQECKAECLRNCSCVAYANSDVREGGNGCLIWLRELIDIRELSLNGGFESEIYIRLASSEIESFGDESNKRKHKIIIVASISSGLCIFILLLLCITWKLRKRAKGEIKDDDIELPLFDLATIKFATNNFSSTNIVGEGGFGTVYKGRLLTGEEIAVKRLSKNSRQGLKEFKNEAELIAKLQHKNLVALLGCCVQEDEKMLIYEYMPNKSLDHYIFDRRGSNLLSWENNYEIIMGIARGLLYLHQDSKLPIIHRDLKAANVLLDSDMTPKISDFGLARIFGGGEKENKTNTIVGTFGYISPEYAVDGIFSVKSDTFSFGVLLLEIVSGKRNRRFCHKDHDHNLVGHAWLLWNKGEASELMDTCFKESKFESQILRCIHVGLLCVQKRFEDRPTMSSVIAMLSNEEVKLPHPKLPGFFVERSSNNNNNNERSTSRYEELNSENTMTVTLQGR